MSRIQFMLDLIKLKRVERSFLVSLSSVTNFDKNPLFKENLTQFLNHSLTECRADIDELETLIEFAKHSQLRPRDLKVIKGFIDSKRREIGNKIKTTYAEISIDGYIKFLESFNARMYQ